MIGNAEIPVAPLDIPTLPQIAELPVTQNDFRNADQATESSPVVQSGTEDAHSSGGENAASTVSAEDSQIVTRAEHEALKARVTALESANGQVAA